MSKFPYPGLRPFHRDETAIFFGREEQVDQLLDKLDASHFMAVVGSSGCGKSSLVTAGMLPALESGFLANAGARWRTAEMRPGKYPMRHLAAALLEESALGQERKGYADSAAFLLATLRRGPQGLVEALNETPLPDDGTNLLILVDQFEEIFRYHQQDNIDEADAFVALLLASAKQKDIPVFVVVTMRSDFLGDCALFTGLPEAMNENQFLTPRLTREQRREAITGPAGVFGSSVETHLVNHLLNEMESIPDQLPVLQHCLMRMWSQTMAREGLKEQDIQPAITGLSKVGGIIVTQADYDAVGALKKALSNHANEAFEKLDQKQQGIAKQLFRCLSEGVPGQRDTRRPTPLHKVAEIAGVSTAEVIEVVEVFRSPERCFLTPAYDVDLNSDSMLDMSHESLIRQWDKLNKWAEQEAESAETYRRLEKTARLWKQGRAALWDTPDLEIALDWQNKEKPTAEWTRRYGENFDLAIEFLDTSAQAQKEKRRKEVTFKYIKQLLAVALIGLFITAGLAAWAFWERSQVEKTKDKQLKAVKRGKVELARANWEWWAEKDVRIKAEYDFMIAEERRQEAEKARKLAKEAQENAESNSDSFREMVNATFGFLSESGRSQEFLVWAEKTFTIEKLIPALELMIDQSESIDKEQKKLWLSELPTMSTEQKADLLDTLGKTQDEEEFHIRQVVIKDENGAAVPLVKGICFIKALEKVTIEVEVDNPSNRGFEIEYSATQGQTGTDTTYTAPNAPGSTDIVTIKVLDNNTKKTITQESIVIQIIG